MGKTNSNSMAAILIAMLNSEKKKFRKKFFEFLEKRHISLDEKTFFYDGMHYSVNLKEMKGKEVDIYGRDYDGRVNALIEVKTSLGEELQNSQKKGGEYQKTSKVHSIPLIYIIPDDYKYEIELPKTSASVKWSEIYRIANESGCDEFCECIQYFITDVEFAGPITKDEALLFSYPKMAVYMQSIIRKINRMIDVYIQNSKEKLSVNEEEEDNYFGRYYNYKIAPRKTVELWIGLYYVSEFENQMFFVQDVDNDVYYPFQDEKCGYGCIPKFILKDTLSEQQTEFEALLKNILSQISERINK